MTAWKAKRFWTEATVAAAEGGWTVRLDNRPVKTPAKAPLIVPTQALAHAIAAEWDAQTGEVKPDTMPFTRAANSAIDKVAPQRDAVVAIIAAYGASDLLCYRAPGPEALAMRQSQAWDPLLDWADAEFGARLAVTAGVMPVAQDALALDRLAQAVGALDAFQIAAFHDLVSLSGSLVIALAVLRGRLAADSAWALSRIDEDWQIEEWGQDEEAAETAAIKRAAFAQAARFFALCG